MEKLKKSFEQLGIWNTLIKLLFWFSPLIVANRQSRSVIWKFACVSWIKKYTGEDLRRDKYVRKVNQDSNVIWILWLQGEENMPPIVRRCYSSVKLFSGNHRVILLTEDNIGEYIDIPPKIVKLFKNKKMQAAQYSDFVRAELMYLYGGIWLDATVFLTAPIDEDIESANFFMFQRSRLEIAALPISSWFIAAKKPGTYMSERILATLDTYWHNESHLRDNFIFHLIIAALVESDNKFRSEFMQMPYKCNMNPHLLYFSFNDEYSQSEWSYIKKVSNIHKLSWKNLGKPKENTFLYKLLQGTLNCV